MEDSKSIPVVAVNPGVEGRVELDEITITRGSDAEQAGGAVD